MARTIEVREIPLDQLVPSRNLRTEGTDSPELQASIREHGVLQPIRVRPLGPNRFQIIAGHRRFAASRALGLRSISAVIAEETDESAAVQMIVENLQREDLAPLDLTRGIRELQTSFGMTPEEIAQSVSKSPQQIRNYLRLAQLPDEVLERLESGEGRTQSVRGLTPRHVQRLLGSIPIASDADQTPETQARIAEAATTIRQLHSELDRRGVRINAHMADAINSNVQSGRMAMREAVDDVLAHPEKYRYGTKPVSSADELVGDTWAVYRKIQREIGSLVFRLKPEIAVTFPEAQRRDLADQLETYIARLTHFHEALVAEAPRRPPRQLPSGP